MSGCECKPGRAQPSRVVVGCFLVYEDVTNFPVFALMSPADKANGRPESVRSAPDEFSMGYVLFRVANGRCHWRISRILWRISRISSGNADFSARNDDFRPANARFHDGNARFPKQNGDFFLPSAHFQPEKVDFQIENGDFSEASDDFRMENGLRPSERGRASAGKGDWH
jgi:hypothetical protein